MVLYYYTTLCRLTQYLLQRLLGSTEIFPPTRFNPVIIGLVLQEWDIGMNRMVDLYLATAAYTTRRASSLKFFLSQSER